MNRKSNQFYILIWLAFFLICSATFVESADTKGEISWLESTDVKFDGEIGFSQDTMGSMEDLIAKYKRGEKGVKIFATGKIVDMSGKVLAVFNETPAEIVSVGDSEYYQFDKGDWRFRSSTSRSFW